MFSVVNRKQRERMSNTGGGQGEMSRGHVPTGTLPPARTYLLPLGITL